MEQSKGFDKALSEGWQKIYHTHVTPNSARYTFCLHAMNSTIVASNYPYFSTVRSLRDC